MGPRSATSLIEHRPILTILMTTNTTEEREDAARSEYTPFYGLSTISDNQLRVQDCRECFTMDVSDALVGISTSMTGEGSKVYRAYSIPQFGYPISSPLLLQQLTGRI